MVGSARSKVIGLDDALVRVVEENLQETFRRTAKELFSFWRRITVLRGKKCLEGLKSFRKQWKCLAPMKQLLRQA